MLMDWQNQHSKSGYTPKSNLHVQHKSPKIPMIPMTFITDIEKSTLKVHLEIQNTVNSQGNNEQKEQHWRYHNNRLQTILQSHSN
jgi:hypothetical protein